MAQLINYGNECTNNKMVFHSKETGIKLHPNAQRKTKIKSYHYNLKINFMYSKEMYWTDTVHFS